MLICWMFYYDNHPSKLFLSLFPTRTQIHSYDKAQEYPIIVDHIIVILILLILQFHGYKICNSRPISITGSTTFTALEKKKLWSF